MGDVLLELQKQQEKKRHRRKMQSVLLPDIIFLQLTLSPTFCFPVIPIC